MRIFIADDEYLAIQILSMCVKDVLPDAEILTFDTGDSLLEAAKKNPPDIYFLDIEMPEYTGIILAQRINEIHQKANIIFVTGYSEYAFDALDLFASGYVTKPATKEKIARQLENLRYPVADKKIVVKTEPYFGVSYKGEKIKFTRKKTEELLAFLIYKYGQPADAVEIRTALFGRLDGMDIKSNSYFHHLKKDFQDTMEGLGEGDIIRFDNMEYSLDISKIKCESKDKIKSALAKVYKWTN